MSLVYKCDGCGDVWENANQPPRSWIRAELSPNDNTGRTVGDYCCRNCLVKKIVTGRMKQVIEEAGL